MQPSAHGYSGLFSSALPSLPVQTIYRAHRTRGAKAKHRRARRSKERAEDFYKKSRIEFADLWLEGLEVVDKMWVATEGLIERGLPSRPNLLPRDRIRSSLRSGTRNAPERRFFPLL
jgi:hypothetical protein